MFMFETRFSKITNCVSNCIVARLAYIDFFAYPNLVGKIIKDGTITVDCKETTLTDTILDASRDEEKLCYVFKDKKGNEYYCPTKCTQNFVMNERRYGVMFQEEIPCQLVPTMYTYDSDGTVISVNPTIPSFHTDF